MVLDHDTDAAIQRAMIRATARNIQATQVDVAAVGYERTISYTVGAFAHAGSHRVALSYTADGVTAVCDCAAGQRGVVCQHIAAALMAEGMAPVDPAPEPVSDPADEIRALAERLRRYWTTELGNWAEHDALLARLRELRELRSRAEPAPAPWKDPNFINSIMNPGTF